MWSCLQYMSSMFSFSMQQDLLAYVHQVQVNVSDQWMFWLRGGPSSSSCRFPWSPWKCCLGGICSPSTAISISSIIYYDHNNPAATSTTIYAFPTIALTRVWSVSYHMERSYSNWWPYTACITGRLHVSALQLLCRVADVTAWQPLDLVANFVSI